MSVADLLNPKDFFRENYVHQLRQTIEAYSDTMIVLGEALQNSLDAVCTSPKPKKGLISVELNFNTDTVTVRDNGIGFPRDLKLLYLGGGRKKNKLGGFTKGKVGVGIKVTMFCSKYFCVRSNDKVSSWKIEIHDAYDFEKLDYIEVPDPLPEDPAPLDNRGTELIYQFPSPNETGKPGFIDLFVEEIYRNSFPTESGKSFRELVINQKDFLSPFAALLSTYLRRFTYVGDVLPKIGKDNVLPTQGIEINIRLICDDPFSRFSKDVAELFGQLKEQEFKIRPEYLLVTDTIKWGTKNPKIFRNKLGHGGKNLERTLFGFNIQILNSPEEYESILINAMGKMPERIKEYQDKLFPHVNGIILTIGRIPLFETHLPGGSRRIISCNGVVTSHELDLTRGRNQEYVRCFDFVIDLDADLNYGKTHLTNMHLVKLARDYVNDAYVRVIQNATANWVGKVGPIDEEKDVFFDRPELGLNDFITQRAPRDENDVIGLFFEMAGKGVFEGYKIYGLSQKDTYDCRAAIKRENDNDDVLDPKDESKLRIVEFKLRATELLRDLDTGEKDTDKIDLLIAWDLGSHQSNRYDIYDIEHSNAYKNYSPKRVYPRVTRYIADAVKGREIQIVLLKDIVASLKKTKPG